jgi:hypothetical protein
MLCQCSGEHRRFETKRRLDEFQAVPVMITPRWPSSLLTRAIGLATFTWAPRPSFGSQGSGFAAAGPVAWPHTLETSLIACTTSPNPRAPSVRILANSQRAANRFPGDGTNGSAVLKHFSQRRPLLLRLYPLPIHVIFPMLGGRGEETRGYSPRAAPAAGTPGSRTGNERWQRGPRVSAAPASARRRGAIRRTCDAPHGAARRPGRACRGPRRRQADPARCDGCIPW